MKKNLFTIDNQSRVAVFEQIIRQTERLILANALKPHDLMPSVRSLSIELSVNPNTIQKAYSILAERGLIYVTPGRGSFVSEGARNIIAQGRMHLLEQIAEAAKECSLAGIEKSLLYQAIEKGYGEKRR